MRIATALALVLPLSLPGLALAAGSDSTTPPKPTATTQSCTGVQVWDEKVQKCVDPKKSDLGSDTLYEAVRELAYAGRYTDAQAVLAAMPDQSDDRVLTYWGFTHRKMGHADQAQAFYDKALARNPDNLLARSYMGQGLVAQGRIDGAIAQWREIKARGGEGTWAEASLREAIRTGATYSY
ncbi:tetratricopeptide repeat protein [Seohaeicola nanhaiensis]|uniref:Tetratricopeptide repeat protein n=1 Tax=Seohaeicola nanhaiensis TaxID=1387282 RepID=A0ABV9KJV1_9RHOB